MLAAVARLLDDPVPRVRRNAADALGCVVCKPDWQAELPDDVAAKLARVASDDPEREGARRSRSRSRLSVLIDSSLSNGRHFGLFLGWRGSSGGTIGRLPVPSTSAQPQ